MNAWYRICEKNKLRNGDRLHCCVSGRFITIFRENGNFSAMDSVCHHAGGPLTLGKLTDIEDLQKLAVVCPWHRFLISVDSGQKLYQAVEV